MIHSHKSSIVRRRFSLAHEIGHILLNHAEKKYPSLRRHNIEKLCNKIAAELLLPKKIFEKTYSERELKEILGKSVRYYREKYRMEMPYEVFEDIETNGFRLKPEVVLAFKEYLGVSIDVLLSQLHWTNFLNLCNSLVLISKKSFNVFRGNDYDFRVYHRASPKWMYIPRNIRIREVISLNIPELFEKLNCYEKSNSKNEKLLVKVKKDEKWRSEVIESETECMRLSDGLILSVYY